MPLPVIAGVYRTTLDWTLGGGQARAHNVLHFGGASGSEPDLFAALGAHLTDAMVNDMSDQSHLDGIDILELDGTAATVSHILDGTYTGQGSSDALIAPAELIKLQTPVRGPAHRGRIFLPFVAEGSTSDGFIGNPATAQGGWTTFLADMAGDGWNLVVASYVHASATVVTSVSVEGPLGTIRRRQQQLR